MGALRPRRLALLLPVVLAAIAVPAPAEAAPGDLATVAGTVATGTATSIAMAPRGVAVNSAGTVLYIADQDNNAIRRVDLTTGAATVVAGIGAPNNSGDNGQATAAGLNNPYDVDLDSAGNLIIASTSNHRIRKVTVSTGVITLVAGTSAGYSGDNGAATAAQLQNPSGVAVAPNGDIYIADTDNFKVRKVSAATGVISAFATFPIAPATSPASVRGPEDIAFDSAGNVYVTDCYSNTINRYPPTGGTATVVAGIPGAVNSFSGDLGLATAANLACPTGIYIDATDTIYFADSVNDRLRRFTVGGLITTFAGTGTTGLSGDGGLATAAALDRPTDLARDGLGNFYFAQGALMSGSSVATTAVVRKITALGVISTVAGNTWKSWSGDGGQATAAQLGHPAGAAVDATGTVFVADSANNRIRKITTAGVISTVAGTGLPCVAPCGNSDIADGGTATAGNLYNPQAVAVTTAGDLYIADTGHNRIRKVTAAGVISTVAGTGSSGNTDGAVATAKLSKPYGLAVTAAGAVYFADQGSHKIRMVSGGVVSTVAGSGTGTFGGDGGAPTSADLKSPTDVRFDRAGDIYIADTGNHVIRRVHAGVISTVAGTGGTAGSTGDGGLATAATLSSPGGLEFDGAGNIYIADTGNHAVRRVDRHGIIHNVAGKLGSGSWGGDGAAGAASGGYLFSPARLALDSAGDLYIPSSGELRVRMLTTQGTAATFWVSDATAGHTGTTYGWEFVGQTATALGKITFTVPSGTTNAVPYLVSTVDLPTTGTMTLSGTTLTYTFASPITVPAGRHVYLSAGGFTNTATTGPQYSTVTTLTSGGTTVDTARSGAISFTTPSATVLPVPNPTQTVTVAGTTTIQVDPLIGADVSTSMPITVRTNATHGYTVSVHGTAVSGAGGTITAVSAGQASAVSAAAFGADRIGYTVAGVGGSAAGSAAAALSGAYAGYTSGGETAVTATAPTSVTGDVIALVTRIRADRMLKPGTYTGTISYTVTPSY
ncbi:NHL domain-containing protein [Paractinoplanes durhamensis]|uniref:Teneurin NHL domain-containing protein n=1 Tax=Paractinoplanes durhamensis TaxID=113563 RepID=A0ABQ3YTZ0_9ACTN|nr:hypothetical protein [Actinoplanes durhamensis]GIE01028.1 hypothetical protein Adu01nite_23780 [Actinoplanes durhamensis]